MGVKKRILLIDDTQEIADAMREAFTADSDVELICSSSARNHLRKVLHYDYYIIYIHHDGLVADLHNLVDFMTGFLNGMKPVLLAITSDEATMVSTIIPGVGFLPKPVSIDVLHKQALNAISILSVNRSINDISHLPGNYAIDITLRDKIEKGEKFVLVYLDIDKFKSYTDYYGLNKANLLIAFLAKVLRKTVRKYGSKKDFIGHVGGDDYVLILNDYDYAEKIGHEVIQQFEESIQSFYNAEDNEKGYIEVLNRKGKKERFGVVSLSIAMVSNEFHHFASTDEVYQQMMEAKNEAKQISGSVMLCDHSKV
ncbi:MAG: diguanylate cyclase [Bacteroidaceae bacterium]|nr:diguanylate cyclase [Bacteroidaceae bacterium]